MAEILYVFILSCKMAISKNDRGSLANNHQVFTETYRPLASRSGIKVITLNLRSLHTKFRPNRTNDLVSEAAGSLGVSHEGMTIFF